MLSIEKTLDMMQQYGLTAEEQLVVVLLFNASREENQQQPFVDFFINKLNQISLFDLIISLQEKGVILSSYKVKKGSDFDPELVEFNKNFLKNYFKFSNYLGKELFDEYPHFVTINGITYNIANFAKKFNSEDEFFRAYGKNIGWDLKKHNEIIDLVKWAKRNTNFLNHNICDFVISKEWDRLKELKNGDVDVNIIFDNITCL